MRPACCLPFLSARAFRQVDWLFHPDFRSPRSRRCWDDWICVGWLNATVRAGDRVPRFERRAVSELGRQQNKDTAGAGADVLADRPQPCQRVGVDSDSFGQIEAFARHLRVERGRSEHTQRAYLGDLRNLMAFAGEYGIHDVSRLRLSDLRSWLAHQSENGAARATIARRAASARAFLRWATRTGLIDTDPSLRLVAPKRLQTLPGVLKQDEVSTLHDAARGDHTRQAARTPRCRRVMRRV